MTRFNLASSNIGWRNQDNDAVFRKMADLGYVGIEIAPTKIVPENPYEHIEESRQSLQAIRESYGLRVCSMQSIWRGQSGTIFDSDKRKELLAYSEEMMRYAAAIDCPNLVFGCPGNRNMLCDSAPEDVIPFFEACGDMAAANGTVMAIEANPVIYNTNFLNTTEEACNFLSTMPFNVGLALNLDLGTILYNEESVESLMPFMPFVNHVHISEPHLAPVEKRKEHEQLRDILIESKYRGYVSLEMAEVDIEALFACLEYVAEVFR